MKRTLSLFLTLVMALSTLTSVPVTVSSASVDDLTFELNDDGTMYQVKDCVANTSGDIVIPGNYNGLTVTKIASDAFKDCRYIRSVSIPDSVTIIGYDAFSGCKNLTSITIPDSVTSICGGAFRNCTNLTSVTIGDSVTSIGYSAFRYCENLTSIKISDSVTNIGDSAFYGCTSLTSIEIPDSVISIDYDTFYNCTSLKSVIIGDSVTAIGARAFYNCTSLTSVTIGDSVTSIGSYALGYKYSDWEEKSVIFEGFTIYGTKGSVAETYAKENGFEFIKIGCKQHTSSNWITDKNATVNNAGKKVKKCTECGEVLETAEIPQLKCSKPKLKKIENTSSGVKISWGKVSGVDKYEVYRKVKGGSYSKIGTTTKTYYTDKKAKSGKKYYYVVKAVNEAGSSDSSSSKSILYLADPTLKTPKSTKKGITLNWSKVTGAQGYVIYYKTGSGNYKKLTTVKGNSKVKYTHTKAKKGKTYTYKVKAYYSKTYSAYSNAKKIKDKY